MSSYKNVHKHESMTETKSELEKELELFHAVARLETLVNLMEQHQELDGWSDWLNSAKNSVKNAVTQASRAVGGIDKNSKETHVYNGDHLKSVTFPQIHLDQQNYDKSLLKKYDDWEKAMKFANDRIKQLQDDIASVKKHKADIQDNLNLINSDWLTSKKLQDKEKISK